MYICDKCDQTFDQTPGGKQMWLEHRASHAMQGKIPETATEQVIKKSMSAAEIRQQKVGKKVTLSYKWDGECPTCGNYVDTIVIEAGQPKGKVVAVAFCGACKKEVAYRPVEKL